EPIKLNAENKTVYQSIMGELLYAANISRPDIAFQVGRLCQYMSDPHEHQLQAAKRVMRFLSQTADDCLLFGTNEINHGDSGATVFSDSDYAECKETRRSTSGCIVVYNGDIIHWFSRKQKLVTLSSTEAEYVALGEAVKELLWCRSWLLEVYEGKELGPMTVYEDNQSTIRVAKNGELISQRTKHIDIRYHFIREHIDNGTVKIEWVESKEQLADILTKPLQGGALKYIRDKILCVSQHPPDYGRVLRKVK
ncbi:MAG TPA: Ty1/Copia family ribonuclease HI, partial [Candidatus Babeliaceae bacterium]|nr:Ty1/Copia family ribonuclease HI [Candidatus Babeliaceae bacterium]